MLSSSEESFFILSMSWELSEAEFRSDGLVCLLGDVSRQTSTEAVVWSLLNTLNLGFRFTRATNGSEGVFLNIQFTEQRA